MEFMNEVLIVKKRRDLCSDRESKTRRITHKCRICTHGTCAK